MEQDSTRIFAASRGFSVAFYHPLGIRQGFAWIRADSSDFSADQSGKMVALALFFWPLVEIRPDPTPRSRELVQLAGTCEIWPYCSRTRHRVRAILSSSREHVKFGPTVPGSPAGHLTDDYSRNHRRSRSPTLLHARNEVYENETELEVSLRDFGLRKT